MKKIIIFSLLATSLVRIYTQQTQNKNPTPLINAQQAYTDALTNLINQDKWDLVLQGIMYPVEFSDDAMVKLGKYINSDKFTQKNAEQVLNQLKSLESPLATIVNAIYAKFPGLNPKKK